VEKKTIMAVFLIAMLFIVYTMVTRKPQQKPEESVKEEEVVEKETEKVKQEKKRLVEEVIEVTEADTIEEKMVNVHTNLFDAEFSTVGGTLKSIKLLKYPGKDGKPVELIHEGFGSLQIALMQTEKELDLGRFPTLCSKEGIDLITGLKDSLVFVYAQNDTPFLKKVFVFYPDSYIVDLHLEFPKEVSQSIKLSFDSGIALTEKDTKDEMAYVSFVGKLGEHTQRMNLRAVKETKSTIEGNIDWAGVTSKYFLFLILPEDTIIKKISHWKIEKQRIGFSITTGDFKKGNFALYFGPLEYFMLRDMGRGLEGSIYFGWKYIAPISKVIFFIFKGIHKVIPNYGFVIIFFSVIMMLIFLPLTIKQHTSMMKMQKLQPKMDAIRKKFKDDPQKMNAETMKLYSREKVNPFGGCLPLLLQMPVFFALYAVLRSTIELRRAPFIFWIKDLSMKDPFFILPILMGLAMFVQQKMTVSDPRQKAMTYFMPIFLVFIFSRLPSGIVLYWFIYNILSVLQQYMIKRREKEGIEHKTGEV